MPVGVDRAARIYARAILSLIREHGFTQRMVARGLGVSEAYLSRLLRDPGKLEAFLAKLGEHRGLIDLHRAARDAAFRKKLQVELAFPEVEHPRWPTLLS